MPDRPIIFSAAMVRALLAGRKTQTRRLATSLLRRCQVGDRLYVRESWCSADTPAGAAYLADHEGDPRGIGWRPSIHMPRWASRLTLIVEGVTVEPVQAISEADILAEGVDPSTGQIRSFVAECRDGQLVRANQTMTRQPAFRHLWDGLHDKPGERWAKPQVVALTFRVEQCNIDKLEKAA